MTLHTLNLDIEVQNKIKDALNKALNADCKISYHLSHFCWRLDISFGKTTVELTGESEKEHVSTGVAAEVGERNLITDDGLGSWVMCYLDNGEKSSEIIGDFEMKDEDHKRLEKTGFIVLDAIKDYFPALNDQADAQNKE